MAETKPNVFVRFGKGIARFFRDGKAEVKKVGFGQSRQLYLRMPVLFF